LVRSLQIHKKFQNEPEEGPHNKIIELEGFQVHLQIMIVGGPMEYSHETYIKQFDPIAFMICIELFQQNEQSDPIEFLDLYLHKIYPDSNYKKPYSFVDFYGIGEKQDVPIEIVYTKFDLKNKPEMNNFFDEGKFLKHIDDTHHDFISVISTSSKSGLNVKNCFEDLVYSVWNKYGHPKK
jgi:hypothetical protein